MSDLRCKTCIYRGKELADLHAEWDVCRRQSPSTGEERWPQIDLDYDWCGLHSALEHEEDIV